MARKNAYYCDACRGYVVTVDRDEGVTPMFLACRVKGEPTDARNRCKGQMVSMMYPPEPWPEKDGYGAQIPTTPTWEWYSPDADERAALDDATSAHVEKGGLLLRRIGHKPPPPPPRKVRRAARRRRGKG
jgi:hypothetical protein